ACRATGWRVTWSSGGKAWASRHPRTCTKGGVGGWLFQGKRVKRWPTDANGASGCRQTVQTGRCLTVSNGSIGSATDANGSNSDHRQTDQTVRHRPNGSNGKPTDRNGPSGECITVQTGLTVGHRQTGQTVVIGRPLQRSHSEERPL